MTIVFNRETAPQDFRAPSKGSVPLYSKMYPVPAKHRAPCRQKINGNFSKIFFFKYLGEFLILLREIFCGSKTLSSCCDKYQHFDYVCSCYPGSEAQSPEFWEFWASFELFVLAQVISLGHLFFYKKFGQCIYFHV